MNYYVIILVLFSLTGVVLTFWGWQVMAKSRERKSWPTAQGRITASTMEKGVVDIFPRIEYEYRINGKLYHDRLEFPAGTQPTPEFCQACLRKYPLDANVTVYYAPNDHSVSDLDPTEEGDWMILVLGVLLMVFGAGFALSGI